MSLPMFDFEPSNEMGVVLLFGRYYDALGFESVPFKDAICKKT